MTALSNKQKQAALADRHRALGRTQRKKWAHNEDWPQIDKYIDRLNRAREKAEHELNE